MDARKHILLIRLKSIGDIVFTLPAVHAVRENFPQAKLHFLVSKEYAELLRGFSDIDEIVPLDRSMYRSGNPITLCSNFFKLVHDLRQKNFSRVIDFQGYGETAWLSWWSGAPERWGSVYQMVRAWAYTQGIQRGVEIHPAEWNLSLLQRCGLHIGNIRNQYSLPAESLNEAKRFFLTHNLDENKPTLFIQPFTSSPHKNWPLENFLELARHFQSQGIQIIFGGGSEDREQLGQAKTEGFVISAGTSLLVTGGLMKLSRLIVGGDTGLMHLAVAMGKQVVMLMHRADSVFLPFCHNDWAIAPLRGQNIREIAVEKIISIIHYHLEQ